MFAALALSGCATHQYDHLPSGDAAYSKIPPSDRVPVDPDYHLGAGDELSIKVFDEPDLEVDKVVVDDGGKIQFPLVGSVTVGGLTSQEASALIEKKLGERFLRNPQVALNVTTLAQHFVSVEGQVTKAGAYPVSDDTTLLSAISMAQSPTRIARLDEVVVFRTIDGQRFAARFNVERIRAGLDPDPKILGGDTVVIGLSQAKSIYRDFLQAAPFFNIFTRL